MSIKVTQHNPNIDHLVEALLSILPAPSIVTHKLRPMIVIGTWSPGVDTEIDGCTPSEPFASTIVDLPPFKIGLWKSVVTPVVAWRHESPVSLTKRLLAFIHILSARIDEQDSVLW